MPGDGQQGGSLPAVWLTWRYNVGFVQQAVQVGRLQAKLRVQGIRCVATPLEQCKGH